MDALALCKIETIEIALWGDRGGLKVGRVTAHRHLDFGVHREDTGDFFNERWCITHLPSGRRAAGGFNSIEPAAAAMVEIARLRNDWFCADDEVATRETAAKVEEIVKRHDPRARVANKRSGMVIENTLNGYSSPTTHQSKTGE